MAALKEIAETGDDEKLFRAVATGMLANFKAWGWDAKIETFDVLYPTPISETLELLGPNASAMTAQAVLRVDVARRILDRSQLRRDLNTERR